ncbi:MAG: undecaprenyldiphospho-muramoylpentapeptide beta-N-acetylglucosaminyltransferase [Clostridia bacterium]|nr:undecaprenyldiphospho-muramoylpentapeptide beta-N-acetylglucosaminyltransferase [Clostridia bacterium]
MKILLTGGGTGGHVYPALAIADMIKEKQPDAEILYVGTKRGMENALVAREGYPMYHIECRGVHRSLSPANLITAYYVLTAPHKAKRLLRTLKPDAVIGTGGYACWAPLKAAAALGIPTMVHESNVIPGMAVRQLQGEVDVVLTNFEATAERLRTERKVVHVGNPLRKSYGSYTRKEAREKLGIPEDCRFLILSFGGSRGAEQVNRSMIDLMRDFVLPHPDVMHIHAGGKDSYEQAKALFDGAGLGDCSRTQLQEYIYDMPLYMAAADLCICRAGAMTLTEIARMGKTAIVIPSPNVVEDHQYKNAKLLADADAAVLLEEANLTPQRIVEEVSNLYENEEKRMGMSQRIRTFGGDDAGEKIYEELIRLLKTKEKIVPRG